MCPERQIVARKMLHCIIFSQEMPKLRFTQLELRFYLPTFRHFSVYRKCEVKFAHAK